MTKIDFSKLDSPDLYSLILFILYKLQDIPSYATLSQLIFLLDKDTILKLCSLFGGQTLQIPKISELQEVLDALTLYYEENILHKPSDIPPNDLSIKLEELLNDYIIK